MSADKPRGIIAGALENGSLDLWSADALISQSSYAYRSPADRLSTNVLFSDSLISRTTKHTGAIKALQFNPFKSELLATAGAKGEVHIFANP